MEFLGDVGHAEPRFDPVGDSVSVGATYLHVLRRTYHRLRNRFGCTRWNSLVTWVMWNLVSIRLEIVLVLVQDRWTVCARCTIGSKIVLDATNDTPW